MKNNNILKKLIFSLLFLTATLVNSQKIKFKIENGSENNTIIFTSIDDEVLKSVYEKERTFEVDYLNFDEGYYILKKDKNSVVLYLKPTDELTVSFDDEEFYETLSFSGEGSYVNNYLFKKRKELVDRRGKIKKYYKRSFYEGGENEYLNKLDRLYKENYGVLFSTKLSKEFKDNEMKNLQYGYSLDLLKYEDAKKYYNQIDSTSVSKDFLEPLTHVNFQNSQLYQKYNSYKELAVLKWKKDIEVSPDFWIKKDILESIRIKALQQAILEALYEDMSEENPERTEVYYKLIREYADNKKILTKAKTKYAGIHKVEAIKNLSKFKYLNNYNEPKKLSDFAGKYILLNIWTTWCKPCMKDFKAIEKLETKFEDENIAFVSVVIAKETEFEDWVNVLKENGLKGEKHLYLNDLKENFIQHYDIKSIPSYVLLSAQGLPTDANIQNIASKGVETTIRKHLEE